MRKRYSRTIVFLQIFSFVYSYYTFIFFYRFSHRLLLFTLYPNDFHIICYYIRYIIAIIYFIIISNERNVFVRHVPVIFFGFVSFYCPLLYQFSQLRPFLTSWCHFMDHFMWLAWKFRVYVIYQSIMTCTLNVYLYGSKLMVELSVIYNRVKSITVLEIMIF